VQQDISYNRAISLMDDTFCMIPSVSESEVRLIADEETDVGLITMPHRHNQIKSLHVYRIVCIVAAHVQICVGPAWDLCRTRGFDVLNTVQGKNSIKQTMIASSHLLVR